MDSSTIPAQMNLEGCAVRVTLDELHKYGLAGPGQRNRQLRNYVEHRL